jgi:hypothetical protein
MYTLPVREQIGPFVFVLKLKPERGVDSFDLRLLGLSAQRQDCGDNQYALHNPPHHPTSFL